MSSKVSKETLYECVQEVLKASKETKPRKFVETVDLQIGLPMPAVPGSNAGTGRCTGSRKLLSTSTSDETSTQGLKYLGR